MYNETNSLIFKHKINFGRVDMLSMNQSKYFFDLSIKITQKTDMKNLDSQLYIYIYIQGSLNKFPDFLYGHFYG